MPLQDRQEFQDWIADYQQREREVHGRDSDRATCTACGLTADDQQIVGNHCVECLAFDYGVEHTERRVSRIGQAIATTLVAADPHGAHRLVQHFLDRMEDVLDDLQADAGQ